MKDLKSFISESINEAKAKTYKNITVGDYFNWFTGETFSRMNAKQFFNHGLDYLAEIDEFNGNEKKLFDFLKSHVNDKITITEKPTEYDDLEHTFKIDGVEFSIQAMAEYGTK